MRRAAILGLLAVFATLIATPTPAASVVRSPVSFGVKNPFDPAGEPLTVAGTLVRPSTPCASSVLLMVHGLSYGQWAWDFPLQPETYSVSQALAERGYASVTIDLPGYGDSTIPNGYTLTVESYAFMVADIARQLDATFGAVGLAGHSAGTEITELAAGLGLFSPSVYIPTAYTHVPSQRIAVDFFTGDYIRAAQDDYERFGGTDQGRTEYMYAPLPSPLVDPAVVAKDFELENLTPSGEIYSIGPQPSKLVMALITAPTLLVLAEKDLLFPIDYADLEFSLFHSASDRDLLIVPDAGHSFMLHTNAPATNDAIGDWLGEQSAAHPAC